MPATRHCLLRCVIWLACLAGLPGADLAAQICKWVDENGVTHYADRCPEGVDAESMAVPAPLSPERVEQARQHSEALTSARASRRAPGKSVRGFRSLALDELGPLPENRVSRYLETTATSIGYEFKNLAGYFSLSLHARHELQPGALVEVVFPQPAEPDNKDLVEQVLTAGEDSIIAVSPAAGGFRCWNYEVEVRVYADAARSRLLDTHSQVIQSRVDLALVRNSADLVDAMTSGGRCPAQRQQDYAGMSADQLQALCEAEREKRLAPMRAERIRQCQEAGEMTDEQCVSYWADFGDAMAVGGNLMRRELFSDLPACIAARKVREEGR